MAFWIIFAIIVLIFAVTGVFEKRRELAIALAFLGVGIIAEAFPSSGLIGIIQFGLIVFIAVKLIDAGKDFVRRHVREEVDKELTVRAQRQ